MESIAAKDPGDDQITNKDDSVTNKDGNNSLEKGEQRTHQKKADEKRVPTVTPDNDNGDPGPPVKNNSSNKNGDPSNDNL
jgi:hypothetical protein